MFKLFVELCKNFNCSYYFRIKTQDMKTPQDITFVKKTGRMSVEKYLSIYYNEFYEYIKQKYSDSNSISEMIYRYFNGIDEIPV